jgi:phosphoribosylaminoimidazole carboxylase (NCAIR synthetase)
MAAIELPRVGVLGGGQLGRMLAEAALPLGIEVVVLDPSGPQAPAAAPATRAYRGHYAAAADVLAFVDDAKPHVLTVEIEHVNVQALFAVERTRGMPQDNGRRTDRDTHTHTHTHTQGHGHGRWRKHSRLYTCARGAAVAAVGIRVYPAPATIALIQDKYLQKIHFQYVSVFHAHS